VTLGTIVGLILSGLVIGGLARLAVPGPDPMPIWATILLGLAGSFLGGGVGYALADQPGAFLASVVAATLLVLGYRRFVQKRPITGPGARRPPVS
jgi:uncharacterized membrane protein YeaQ/YmgE (transglycosylase-associated protein family)